MPPRFDPSNDFKLLSAIIKNLEGRFVDWQEVGNLLGISRSAAQQRWEGLRRCENNFLRGVVINSKTRAG
jgi:hypothetical protein